MVVLSIIFFLVGCAIAVLLATSCTYFNENSRPNQNSLAEFYIISAKSSSSGSTNWLKLKRS